MKKNLVEWLGFGLSVFILVSSIVMVYGGRMPQRIDECQVRICSIEQFQRECTDRNNQVLDTLMIRTAVILSKLDYIEKMTAQSEK